MTGKELSNNEITPEMLARVQELTGGGSKTHLTIKKIVVDYRDELPDETKNPNHGGFSFVETKKLDDGGFKKTHTTLGTSFECIILRARYMAKFWDDKSKTTLYHTKEFDEWAEPINLYDNDNKIVDRARYSILKAKYKLKPVMILYVYYQDEVCRLQLSSKSLGIFWDYQKFFMDTAICFFKTIISTTKERKNPTAPPYFLGKFKMGEEVDNKKSLELILGLNKFLIDYEKARDAKYDEGVLKPDGTAIEATKEVFDTSDIIQKEAIIDLPF